MPDFSILLRNAQAQSIVYLIGDHGEAEAVAALLRDVPCLLAAVPCEDWNRDLSPWPAPPVFRNEGFAGEGEAFLRRLTEETVPACEAWLRAEGFEVPPVRVLCGYSLAGLFSLWAAVRSPLFQRAASVSGSLWFDGFVPWLEEQPRLPERVYLSIGDREERTRNERMKRGRACMEETHRLLLARGVGSTCRVVPGDHFHDVPQRIANGIRTIAVL